MVMKFYQRLKGMFRQTLASEETIDQLDASLAQNIKNINQLMGNSPDVIVREFYFGADESCQAAVVYVKSLTDEKQIQDFILETMLLHPKKMGLVCSSAVEMLMRLKNRLTVSEIKEFEEMQTLLRELLSGRAILLLDGAKKCLAIGVQGWEKRSVTEPPTQTVMRGPREGFTEDLVTNISLIRRRIKDARLHFEVKRLGTITKTNVAMMYIQGVTDERILNDLRKRLDTIEIEGVFESGTIEQAIEGEGYTPFPTIFNTERPDVVAAGLVEGRIAILVDGSPFVLLAPSIFSQFYQTPEDYYQRGDFGTLIRILRYIGLIIALTGPAFYIAVTTFHQEMIPHSLLINLASQQPECRVDRD